MEKTEKIVYPGNPDFPGDDYVVQKVVSVIPEKTKDNIIQQVHLKQKRKKEKAHERTV